MLCTYDGVRGSVSAFARAYRTSVRLNIVHVRYGAKCDIIIIYVHVYRVYVDARAIPSRGLALAYVSAARRSRLE